MFGSATTYKNIEGITNATIAQASLGGNIENGDASENPVLNSISRGDRRESVPREELVRPVNKVLSMPPTEIRENFMTKITEINI